MPNMLIFVFEITMLHETHKKKYGIRALSLVLSKSMELVLSLKKAHCKSAHGFFVSSSTIKFGFDFAVKHH